MKKYRISKAKNQTYHFKKRCDKRIGTQIDRKAIQRRIKEQNYDENFYFLNRQSNRVTRYRYKYQDKWYINWENNGWKNSKGDPVANKLEWRFLIKFFKDDRFTFTKVKGHSGHVYNERADALAQGKCAPTEPQDLTTNKKYDTIHT